MMTLTKHKAMEKRITLYIASSWKNQHAVEMLTTMIRATSSHYDVKSFVENAFGEGYYAEAQRMSFQEWYNSANGEGAFRYDSHWASNADLVIYLCPSGKDAMCEIGMAYANKKPILGLWSKGEDDGLMHKCVTVWYEDHARLLKALVSIVDGTDGYLDFLKTKHHHTSRESNARPVKVI
jgi:hypothetical protein